MFPNTRSFALRLLVVSALLLLVGLFTTTAQDRPVLRIGVPAPVAFDPAIATDDQEVLINRSIYSYLIELLPSGDIVPSLAESWDISEDGLTFTFTLVEGATFHNGDPLTAADVVYTFERLSAVGSSAMGLLGQAVVGTDDEGNNITEPTFSVEALDDSTVQFVLDGPNADFLLGIASRFAGILQAGQETPNVLTEDGGLDNFNGTGAFVITEFNQGESITLSANENYWGDVPAIDVQFIFIDDQATQVNALLAGDVDFIFKVGTELIEQVTDVEGITLVNIATGIHPVIRVRSDEGSLGEDVRVRQAFKLATDRELLNLDVLDGAGVVANNDPFSPVFGPLYNPIESEYDPEQACALLAEYAAENPDNPWVTLDGDTPSLEVDFFVVDSFEYPVLAEFMQQQWEEGCINVNLQIRQASVYYADTEWLEVDLGLTGWGTRPTPQAFLNEAYVTGSPFNESHWSNETIDTLAAEASQISDIAARAEIYAEISQIFADEGPIIVPFFRPVSGAYVSNIEGLVMHPFPGRTDLSGVTFGS